MAETLVPWDGLSERVVLLGPLNIVPASLGVTGSLQHGSVPIIAILEVFAGRVEVVDTVGP